MATAPKYRNQLAGNGTQGSFAPFQLLAGEKEIVTTHDEVATGQNLKQFEAVAKNATGQLVAWDPDAVDTASKLVGFMAQPADATSAATSAPYYVSAFFNHEALVWPATVTTLEARKAAVQGTEIQVGTLYGGNW